jgi:hypothetical protein
VWGNATFAPDDDDEIKAAGRSYGWVAPAVVAGFAWHRKGGLVVTCRHVFFFSTRVALLTRLRAETRQPYGCAAWYAALEGPPCFCAVGVWSLCAAPLHACAVQVHEHRGGVGRGGRFIMVAATCLHLLRPAVDFCLAPCFDSLSCTRIRVHNLTRLLLLPVRPVVSLPRFDPRTAA